jgi:hypothetical protein
VVAPEVLNPTANSLHGGQKRVPSITMGDTLVLFTILLSSEVKIDANGDPEGSVINRSAIQGGRAGNLEGGVTEAKRVAIRATVGMLTRTEQVEVTDKEEVTNGRLKRIRRVQRVNSMASKGQRYGLDTDRRRIDGFPRALHLLERTDDIASGI